MLYRRSVCRSDHRRGATTVEFAVVLPVFLTMVWGMIEFGHAFMTMHVLNAAANSAARVGMTEYASTGDVVQRAEQILESAIDVGNVTIDVKDASVFDQPGMDPASVNYDALPDINLLDAEPRQLFVVCISVPYDEVGIMGPKWLTGLNLVGQSVMRHE